MLLMQQVLLLVTIFPWIAYLCFAQTTSASDQSNASDLTSTISNEIKTHTITVGKASNQYSPDSVQAAVNDVIEFEFFPWNHSVARAEYGYPCIPYELTGNKTGFASGFQPLGAILDNVQQCLNGMLGLLLILENQPPTWNLTINDTDPIFFYCSAPRSCVENAMVGVINPDSSVSLDIQKQKARNSTFMLAPGEAFPSGETLPSGTPGPNSPSPNASTASSQAPSSGRSLPAGAIAGIVLGGLAAFAAIGALLFYLGRHRTELEFLRRDLHRQSKGPPVSETKFEHTAQPQVSPTTRYGLDDPKIGEQQSYDVPPYSTFSVDPLPGTAELDSSGLTGSRPQSAWVHGDNAAQDTRSPPLEGLNETLGPDIAQHELAGSIFILGTNNSRC